MEATLPIAQIGNEQAFNPDEVVYLAVKYLAGNCDGAAKRDDIGFNRMHAPLGHKLAETDFRQWSDRQLWAARKMLETYKNTQLAFVWPLMPPLPPEPPKNPYEAARDKEYVEWKRRREPNWQPPAKFRRLALVENNGAQYVKLEQNYDEHLIHQIKNLPQRRFVEDKAGEKYWVVPVHLDTLEAVTTFAIENGYDVPPEVEETICSAIDTYSRRLALSHAADGDFHIDLPPGLELYPFQRIGVQFATEVGNTLIGDEMGLGKTVQGLCTVRVTERYPVVVICPASLKQNWKREARKWLPGKTVGVLDGKVVAPLKWFDGSPALDVVIVNYDILGKWLPHLIDLLGGKLEYQIKADGSNGHQIKCSDGMGTLIVDECHKAKNPKAQRTKNLETLMTACGGVQSLFLSGTPVMNRPMEFWTLISLLGYGKQFGGYMEFKRRYADAYIPDLEEMNTRARMFMIRRQKKQVLTELPDKQYSIVPIEITNPEEYEQAERDVAAYFAKKKADEAVAVADTIELQIQAMQQGLMGDDGMAWVEQQLRVQHKEIFDARYSIAKNNEQLLRWEALKQMAVKGKMDGVISWLDDFLESGRPIIVFATHTNVIKRLAAHYNWPFVVGEHDSLTRDAHVQRFLTDTSCMGILGNIQAMGEGLTLHRADTDSPCMDVAFVEFGWNPAQHGQAEDRIHRIGQKWPVNVWNLTAEGTIEEEIAALIEKKRAITNAMTDGAGKNLQEDFMNELRASLEAKLAGGRK